MKTVNKIASVILVSMLIVIIGCAGQKNARKQLIAEQSRERIIEYTMQLQSKRIDIAEYKDLIAGDSALVKMQLANIK